MYSLKIWFIIRWSLSCRAVNLDFASPMSLYTEHRRGWEQKRSDVTAHGIKLRWFLFSFWLIWGWMCEAQTGYGNKKWYLQPRGCPSRVLLNNSKLQSDSRRNHLSESIKRLALSTIWSFAGTINKEAFFNVERIPMLRRSDCFPRCVLIFVAPTPQNANHPGLSQLICLLWISKGQHLQNRIILVPLQSTRFFSELWYFKEHQLFSLSAMLIKTVCICLHCQSSVMIICIIIYLWAASACLTRWHFME